MEIAPAGGTAATASPILAIEQLTYAFFYAYIHFSLVWHIPGSQRTNAAKPL